MLDNVVSGNNNSNMESHSTKNLMVIITVCLLSTLHCPSRGHPIPTSVKMRGRRRRRRRHTKTTCITNLGPDPLNAPLWNLRTTKRIITMDTNNTNSIIITAAHSLAQLFDQSHSNLDRLHQHPCRQWAPCLQLIQYPIHPCITRRCLETTHQSDPPRSRLNPRNLSTLITIRASSSTVPHHLLNIRGIKPISDRPSCSLMESASGFVNILLFAVDPV